MSNSLKPDPAKPFVEAAGIDARTDIQRIKDLTQLVFKLSAENKRLRLRLLKLGYDA